MPLDELMTSTQAAAALGVSLKTIQRLAHAGTLPVVQKLPGPKGAFLFSRTVVELVAQQGRKRGSVEWG